MNANLVVAVTIVVAQANPLVGKAAEIRIFAARAIATVRRTRGSVAESPIARRRDSLTAETPSHHDTTPASRPYPFEPTVLLGHPLSNWTRPPFTALAFFTVRSLRGDRLTRDLSLRLFVVFMFGLPRPVVPTGRLLNPSSSRAP